MSQPYKKKTLVISITAALSFSLAWAAGGTGTTNYGTNAGAALTSKAEHNTNFGENAGAATTTGDRNTNVGSNAGMSLTTGADTVMIGFNAGLLNFGSDNIFIGSNSGENNERGVDNIFIGARAGQANTDTDNTFIGTEAGKLNVKGSDNTFIGEEAGEHNVDGDDNTFIGENAGSTNTYGNKNTFIGASAGASGSNSVTPGSAYEFKGNNNVTVGYESGFDLKGSASRNTLVGSAAGHDIGTGVGNTMIGANAGPNTEYADFNTFLGVLAGYDNNRTNHQTNANRNTAIGALAGYANREGQDNIWIGAFASSSNAPYSYDAQLESDMESSSGSYWSPNKANLPSGNNKINRTTVLGTFAAANDNDSITIGYRAVSDKTNSLTLGNNASGKGQYDITLGDSASNTGKHAITLGYQAVSTHENAITIGFGATSRADNTLVIGNENLLSWEPATDAVTSLGKRQHCEYMDYPTYDWVCEENLRFSGLVSQNISAVGKEAASAEIHLWADDGDDFDDRWDISAADGGSLSIGSYATSERGRRSETLRRTELFTIENNGNATLSGGLTLNSDKRLKQDIKPIDNAMALIKKIAGVTYFWKDNSRSPKKQYGVIAQNIEAVLPELVKSDPHGIKSVNYQALIPVLINATQEQQKQIDEQKKLIEKQQQQIELLLKTLSSQQ